MRGEYDGMVAIVTGAAQGIGRVTAERLVAAGALVVVADIGEAGARVVEVVGSEAPERLVPPASSGPPPVVVPRPQAAVG